MADFLEIDYEAVRSLLGSAPSHSKEGMAVAVHSEKLRELVDENAEVEQIATGFTFTEGPIWMADGSLHFSDMPGDKRRRWHPDEGVTVLRDPSNKCNGMTLDNDGNLIVCEHVTSSVVRESPDGAPRDARHHWGDKELNSPNDVIVARDGSIIFTDPTYGRMPGFGLEREQELDFQGVYRHPGRRRRPRSCWSTTSRSRTACASRPTSRCSTSTTPTARTSASSTSAPTTSSRTAACSPRTSARRPRQGRTSSTA